MVRIVEYGDIFSVNTLDLVIQLKRTFPAKEVFFGQYICSSHLKSHEKGKTQYSKLSPSFATRFEWFGVDNTIKMDIANSADFSCKKAMNFM